MTRDEAIKWLTEVVTRVPKIRMNYQAAYGQGPAQFYPVTEASAFFAEADAAIKAALPALHPIVIRWEPACVAATAIGINTLNATAIDRALGILQTAAKLAAEGRLGSLVAGVRAETVGELLDQAHVLAEGGYLIPATVVAGGALETHLRTLCVTANAVPAGDGSITKYEGALAQERKNGNEVISVTDGKAVTLWGDMRNKAAHDPSKFNRSAGEVRMMIDGVRQFVARTTA